MFIPGISYNTSHLSRNAYGANTISLHGNMSLNTTSVEQNSNNASPNNKDNNQQVLEQIYDKLNLTNQLFKALLFLVVYVISEISASSIVKHVQEILFTPEELKQHKQDFIKKWKFSPKSGQMAYKARKYLLKEIIVFPIALIFEIILERRIEHAAHHMTNPTNIQQKKQQDSGSFLTPRQHLYNTFIG